MDTEERIRSLREQGDLQAAATAAIEAFGAELFGFLVALLRSEQDANDVFSQTCEDLWVGLPGFAGQCSMRTWLYALARHAASRLRRSPSRRPGRHVPISQLGDVADRVRTETLRHLRTEVKDRFAAIREALGEEDRALLVLRVDRAMAWEDIARVVSDPDPSEADLRRAAARLRKRFQLLKEEIREQARATGLLADQGGEPRS